VLGGVAIALVLAATGGRVATLAPLAAIARRANLPWRVTELQSAVCGGRPGLSDGRTAALWLTDTLFALLRLGAAQADGLDGPRSEHPRAVVHDRVTA